MNQLLSNMPHNMSQHCWAQHVECVWPPCCDMLRHVGCCWLKFETSQIWANNTQHVATCRNKVAKRTQHVAPNNVAICCVGMLRSFCRGLMLRSFGRGFIPQSMHPRTPHWLVRCEHASQGIFELSVLPPALIIKIWIVFVLAILASTTGHPSVI